MEHHDTASWKLKYRVVVHSHREGFYRLMIDACTVERNFIRQTLRQAVGPWSDHPPPTSNRRQDRRQRVRPALASQRCLPPVLRRISRFSHWITTSVEQSLGGDFDAV